MPERRLDFNALEARGIYALQQNVLQAAQQAEQAASVLREVEAEAASVIKDRVPAGVSVRALRIDTRTGEVFAPGE